MEQSIKIQDFGAQLSRVSQLTGFSDPVYAEAHVAVIDYDIVLDILVVNKAVVVLSSIKMNISSPRHARSINSIRGGLSSNGKTRWL